MKKFIALTSSLLLLGGCARTMESDLSQNINELLKHQSEMDSSLGSNRTKPYYKYYLPLDMGSRDSSQLGEVFIRNDTMILMNFDPSAIIIYNYYGAEEKVEQKQETQRQQEREDRTTVEKAAGNQDTAPQDDASTGEKPEQDTTTAATTTLKEDDLSQVEMQVKSDKILYTGTYRSDAGDYYPYRLVLLQYKGQYLIYLDAAVAQFYALSPLASVSSDISTMLLIAKSITYDTEEVLANFSMKNATSSKQQSIDDLQLNLPSVGNIPDLLDQMEQLIGK